VGTAAYLCIIAPFSRRREFRADAGGARLAGRDKMIAALTALQDSFRLPQPAAEPALAALKISGTRQASLFSTHPSLEERIEALRRLPL
ncbi:MAG TPA: M48 family metalloprotease, partial [bacterium]|nr:M48 family metalloprotease [bacterium]